MRLAAGTIVLLFTAMVAVAQTSLAEHNDAIMTFSAWAIGLLGSGVVGLVIYLYIQSTQNQKDMHRTNVENITLLREQMEKNRVMLLETRSVLLQLHGEHKMMMRRCERINRSIDPNQED